MKYPSIVGTRPGVLAATSFTVVAIVAAGAGSLAAQAALPSAEQLTARHVEAIGGRAAVLRPHATRTTGTFEMAAVGLKGDLLIVTEVPNRMITRILVPGMDAIESGYDGEFGWSIEPMAGSRLLSDRELDAMRENSHVLAAVRDPSLFSSMQTTERTESVGRPCWRVRLVWRSGRESHDCYHAESGLLIESTEEVESPVGMIQVSTTFFDYRGFGGVLFPTRTVLTMMGAEQVLAISAVEFDNVDPAIIELPPEIRSLVPSR
jgi:hypothetical protein